MPDEADISHQLGSLSGKLDMILENQRNNSYRLECIEKRVRSLETHRGYLLGIVAAVAFAWTIVFEWAKSKLVGG